MNTVTIYIIATSNYKQGFLNMVDTLQYFLPSYKKTVVLISDGLQEWNNVEKDGINFKVYYIQHYPWPIITLFKMKYILDYWNESDYAFFLNADLQCNKDSDETWLDKDKLICTSSHFSGIFAEKETSKDSKAYVSDSNVHKYRIAAFFGGPCEIVKQMCNSVYEMLQIDLSHNIIPKWHDQSYLYKWCCDHKDLVSNNCFSLYPRFKTNIPIARIKSFIKDRNL